MQFIGYNRLFLLIRVWIEPSIDLVESLYRRLFNSKYDPGLWKSMSIREVFEYDYKLFQRNGIRIGWSAVLVSLSSIMKKESFSEELDSIGITLLNTRILWRSSIRYFHFLFCSCKWLPQTRDFFLSSKNRLKGQTGLHRKSPESKIRFERIRFSLLDNRHSN